MSTPLRIAVVGTRGLPDVHGGVERHCEELYPRLVELGAEVTVFGRERYVGQDGVYRGVKLVSLSAPSKSGVEALAHTFKAVTRAEPAEFDVLHVHSIGPASVVPYARLRGFNRVVVTVHALDHRQKKWGKAAQAYLRMAERVGVRRADAVIAVSQWIGDYLSDRYGVRAAVIPNGPGLSGCSVPSGQETEEEFGVEPGSYLLFVGRLIPDKRVEDLLAAARQLDPPLPVVVVGDSSDTDGYATSIREAGGNEALFPGYVYGDRLAGLYKSALAFVLPSAVEGLPIAMLEAMMLGTPVVCSDIEANLEVLGSPPAGVSYPLGDVEALRSVLDRLRGDALLRRDLAARAGKRVTQVFDWDRIAQTTMQLFASIRDRSVS